jgi:hypothetical protein
MQAVETIVFTALLFQRDVRDKYFSDASDSSFYWYFMTGSWIFLYVVVFLSPRIM